MSGDELFGFRLRQEIGRGAFARVFLAEQANLAGRAVVVKVSAIDGNEPQTLAQLQHTHIVPIYSVHEDARSGLRAVCMPYFGGTTLARMLHECWREAGTPTHGAELVRALRATQLPAWEPASSGPPSPLTEGPALVLLAGTSYFRAVAWIVARLAEGLAHAHARGVLHRDVKPSNILLGADGVPMLLDFNLARSRLDESIEAALGGTVAYMAPEHLRALAGRHPVLTRLVDHRADLYSLGMVLYELLTGQGPFDQSGSYTLLPQQIEALAVERSRNVPSLRARRPDVPWGLESIVRKCLAPALDDRYQDADQLAEDLQAWLDDRPLRYAPELSWKERTQKWLRRHPAATSSVSVGALAALLLVAALFGVVQLHARLTLAKARERQREYQAGTVRALCLLNTASDLNDPDHFRRGVHECESALRSYQLLDGDGWKEPAEWAALPGPDRQALAEDTRELLLLLASARTRGIVSEPAIREALTLLDRAEQIDGLAPSPALAHARAEYLTRLNDTEGAAAARAAAARRQPVTAHDHYLLAVAQVRAAGEAAKPAALAEAIKELDAAVEQQPRHYWSWLQRGITHLQREDCTLAASDFGVCVGLWPESPWSHFNRGVALGEAGKKTEALAHYTAALACDETFLLAYLNRGLLRLELQQYAAALADFDRAADLGRDDAFLHAGRGAALEGLRRPAEADAAFREAFARLEAASPEVQVRTRLTCGFAVFPRRPERAETMFSEVLVQAATQPARFQQPRMRQAIARALYGQAMLAVQRGQPGAPVAAIQLFTRALQLWPSFPEGRRFRAVLLAREGRFPEALADINSCLEREPRSGATLYAAACVSALISEKSPRGEQARQAARQALSLLRQAFAADYGQKQAATDPDLLALHDDRAFQQLTQQLQPSPASKQ